MHDQSSIDRLDLADTSICKMLQNDRDIMVSVELAALRRDVDDEKICRAPNNGDHYFP
jgi:hypothetical protein